MAPLLPPPQENHAGKKEKKPVLPTVDAPCTFPLASALLRHHHLLPPIFSSPPRLSPPPKPCPLAARAQEIHASLVSTAERCFRALGAAASGNPFLGPLLAFPANFQSFCQEIHCKNSRGTNSLSAHNFAAILPGDSVAGLVVANGISNFLNIYNTLLIVRLVLTWFPNSPPAIVSPLSTLCDPYLNIFRGIIPPLGGTLDLSPILAFLVLNAFTSAAAALPAELPVTGGSENDFSASPSSSSPLSLTKMQKKWMQRICCRGSKKCEVDK